MSKRDQPKKSNGKAAAEKNSGPKNSGTVEPTRKAQVFAVPCPRSEHHQNTRVYRTAGQTRYCVCDDCGHTWKQIGPPAGKEAAVA